MVTFAPRIREGIVAFFGQSHYAIRLAALLHWTALSYMKTHDVTSFLRAETMTKNIATLEVKLSALMQERDELDGAIETMIADMADAAPEQRKSGDWAPDGVLTLRYLELTNRQGEVEQDIIDLSRELAARGKPSTDAVN